MATKRRVSHKPRSLAWFKERGFLVDDAERRIVSSRKGPDGAWVRVPGGRTKDLFGVADLLAIRPGMACAWYIQITGASGATEHRRKLLELTGMEYGGTSRMIDDLTLSGGVVWLMIWRKTGGRWRAEFERWDVVAGGWRKEDPMAWAVAQVTGNRPSS